MSPPRGFTLAEAMVACGLAGVLLAVAWPAWREQLLRAGRADGVAALQRLQAAQARFHATHGLYASGFDALPGTAARSEQGRYALHIEPLGADGWRGVAVPQGAQSSDTACAPLTLEVRLGLPSPGPDARCWNR